MSPIHGQAVGGVHLRGSSSEGRGEFVFHTEGLSQGYPGGGWTHMVGRGANLGEDTHSSGDPKEPQAWALSGGRGGDHKAPSRVWLMDRTPGCASGPSSSIRVC